MRFLRQSWAVAAKDLKAEFRTKEAVNASLSFALVILLLFSFAFDPTAEQTREISGGLLWIVFVFAGALILNRSFARELANDCLDALVSSPLSGAALFLGKCVANLVLLTAVELVCLPVFGVFYNVRWTRQFWPLMLVIVLGTWGITVVGTMFSALTVLIPALMAAIQLTTPLIAGQPLTGDLYNWLRLLIGFDVIFTALALGLIDTVLVG
jgi:heme exporter protein B